MREAAPDRRRDRSTSTARTAAMTSPPPPAAPAMTAMGTPAASLAVNVPTSVPFPAGTGDREAATEVLPAATAVTDANCEGDTSADGEAELAD